MIEGTAASVYDHGTVVTLYVRRETGDLYPIHFDHRPFRHFMEDTNLKPGDRIAYDPQTNTVEVLQ